MSQPWQRRRGARIAAVAMLLASCVAAGITVPAIAGQSNQTPTYLNPKASVEARVNDLLHRMTLEEKVGQMDQILVTKLRAPSAPANGDCDGGADQPLQQVCLQRVLIDNHTGSLLSGGTDNPADNTGKGWAEQYNAIQKFAIENSRLHIPIIYGVDAVHGFGHPFQATLFPQSIGMGATWDPAMAEAAGAATRQQLLATGGNWNFAPVQDLARDTRWGRYYETWAEAPVLAAEIGAANVRGMQGGGFTAPEVAATVKHFAGYSQSLTGHDRTEAQLPIRYLQDTILPSYQGGIDAGAATVMVNSGSVNGIPATASHYLLTDVLRGKMGFKGVVISDYGDVGALASAYHVAADFAGAVAKAVNAGIDVSMTPFDSTGWQSAMLQNVSSGAISVARVDQSVRRILTLKFRLGLFDHPFVDASKADAAVTANRDLARKAAGESITLLRNEKNAAGTPTLPLPTDLSKIVVAGPSAGCAAPGSEDCAPAVANQLGGWSVSWQGPWQPLTVLPADDHRRCCIGKEDQIPDATTVYQGIRAAVPAATNVVLARDQQTAVSEAATADAVVVAVGEKPYAEGLGDFPAPALAGDQQALIEALKATGKPVIVVVIAGRPLALGPGASTSALLMAYLPGTEGGSAVADVLFGKVNPSGKLPVSWPSESTQSPPTSKFDPGAPSLPGDQPKFLDLLPGTNSGQGSGYNPLYRFGTGLSYTTFQTSALSTSGTVSTRGSVNVTFTVANTGSRAGTDVVPIYIHQPVSDVVAPDRRLVAFTRVTLDAGASKTVQVSFPVSRLAVTPADINGAGTPTVAPGAYQVRVDNLTAPLTVRR